jgi:armadillo repeat-containing protein 8
MARTDPPAALDALRSAKTPREQLAALKQLKNDIIGHEQRKETIIRHGVVAHLVRSLAGNGDARGKRRSAKYTGGPINSGGDEATSEWELAHQIRLQGVFIVTSLAHGELVQPRETW